LFLVIVAGAAVRLTNSGLGCDDWPNCNETTLVDVSSKHAAIEQVNWLFNGIVTEVVLSVAILAHRLPAARDVVMLARWLVIPSLPTPCSVASRSVSVAVGDPGPSAAALAALVVNVVLIERLRLHASERS
jgi:hypothetical protein